MKRTLLCCALAALAFLPAAARAQAQTANVNVTAKVQSAVAFSNTSDLDFGEAITPGGSDSVAPAAGAKAMLTFNTPATVTVSGTALAGPGGASIPVTYACAEADSGTEEEPAAFPGTCAAGYTTALSGNAQTDHWIFVGGDIASEATATVPAGSYTGSITFTATYTTY